MKIKKNIKIAGTITGIIVLALMSFPFICYYLNFKDFSISNNPESWAQFGDYLNGTFMPLIALAGVVITFMLGIIAERRNDINLKIEQEKHRPLLNIDYWYGTQKIQITMKNKGNGPLLINEFRVLDKNGKDATGIYYVLPPLHNLYDDFTGNQNNKVLGVGEEATLLLFEFNDKKKKAKWESDIEELRHVLKNLKIVINYSDVYGNPLNYERDLQWFGRDELKVKD
jgi:hypothetical protein